MITVNEEHGRRVARTTLIIRSFIVISTGILGAILFFVVTTADTTKNTAQDTKEIVSSIEKQQDSNTTTIDTAQKTLDLIQDCTQPGGECYDEGQRRTAAAVGDIGRLSVYASACAADRSLLEQNLEQRADSIQRCVTRLLNRTTPQGDN